MKVCVDIQSTIARQAGVGRYAARLAGTLPALSAEDELQFFCFDFRGRGMPAAAGGAPVRRIRWCPGRLASLAWKTIGWPPFDAFAGPADVYHFPNFILPPLRKGRSAVTIHDLAFMRFPESIEEKNLRHLSARIRDTVQRADAIITVSEFSAQEICDLLHADRSRVFPIHHGIDGRFRAPPAEDMAKHRRELGRDRPYLLTLGTLEPRKNIAFLIEVFEALTDFDGQLVIAGMPGWKYEPILRRMESSSRKRDIVYLRYVDEAHLPALYAGAEVFVLPSLYEGFGFPPLEAMACGTPVVCSGGGSLPEVVSDAGEIVRDYDVEHWAARIRTVLTDTERRAALVEAGTRRARSFTWEEAARKTWQVYRSLV